MNTKDNAGLINPGSIMVAPRGHGMGWTLVTSRKQDRLTRKLAKGRKVGNIKLQDVRKAYIQKNSDGTGAVTYISSDDDASSASSVDSKSSIRSFADAVTRSNKSGTNIQITNLKNTLKAQAFSKNEDKETSNMDSMSYSITSSDSTWSGLSIPSVIKSKRGINMYKKNRQYDQMVRLVTTYRKDLLTETHLHLAQQLEHEGNFREAESHYVEAKDWKPAVNMYRANDMWDDAIRVAKLHGGASASKQVAFAWAVSLGGEAGAKLLQKFGLIEQAID